MYSAAGYMLHTVYLTQQIIALIEFETASSAGMGPRALGTWPYEDSSLTPPPALPPAGPLWPSPLTLPPSSLGLESDFGWGVGQVVPGGPHVTPLPHPVLPGG